MAFISRYIFRRDIFKDFSIYLDTSPIYAHVFGFAEMFAQRDIFFVNLSLVARNESIVYARFKTLARSRAKPFYFPWTTGLVRLQMVAADRGILPADFLLGVNEVLGGKSFPLINEMAAQFIRQCKAFLESAEDAELPAFDEADEFLRYMTKGKGAVASSIEAVRRIHFELQGIRNFLVASGPETEFAEEIRRHYVPQLDGLLAVLIHDALGKGSEAHINLTSLWWAMVNWIYRRPKIRAILRQAITASPLRPPSFLMDLHIRARTAKDLITKDGE